MAWDRTTNPAISRSRWSLSSPEHVYQALEEYGDCWRARPYTLVEDERLEQALAGRNDRLIDLALAKNASMCSLVAQLYQRALAGSGDADYDRALRLASLSNRNAVGMLNSDALKGTEARTDSELYRLAMEGDGDELTTLLRNPGSRGLLRAVYMREAPLDAIPDERWFQLVYSTLGNKALNQDDSDANGPDLLAWDIQRAVFRLLGAAPTEPKWVWTLNSLLLAVSPAGARAPDSEQAILDVLARWKDLKVPKLLRHDEEEEGHYTPLSLVDEFRCLIAALYGRVFTQHQSISVGRPDADDIALRCAYYGCAELSVPDIAAGHQKDGAVFALAALCNTHVLLKKECRAELEVYLGGLDELYRQRCLQLKERHRNFDARPVTEWLESEAADDPDHAHLQALSGQVTELKTRLASLSKTLFWGLAIVFLAIVWHK